MSENEPDDPGARTRRARFDAFLAEAMSEPHRKTDKLVITMNPTGKKPIEYTDVDDARRAFVTSGANIESDWRRKPEYIERSGDLEEGWCAKTTRGKVELRRNGEVKFLIRGEPDLAELISVLLEARTYATEGEPVPPAREVLFQLLDDIDTASDACKEDDALYRRTVVAIHKRRFDLVEPIHDKPLRWHEDSAEDDS